MLHDVVIGCNHTPQSSDVIDLYAAVGWGSHDLYNEDEWTKILDNSNQIVTAVYNDRLIGFARFLSDGSHDTHLADIVVHPDYQSKGVGRAIMLKADDLFAHTSIYVAGFKRNEAFFLACGYAEKETMAVYSRAKKHNV